MGHRCSLTRRSNRWTKTPFKPGDIVGIGIHTGNALRGYRIGQSARARGAFVIFGGIHATLFPDEAREHGAAHAVVTGDGDLVWPTVLDDCDRGDPQPLYAGGRVDGESFYPARWDLLPAGRYMWASVQTVRGCPKHCSFCSVWRTDGQKPRQRDVNLVVREIVQLRRQGFRFIVLADDNFYPVTLADLAAADRRADKGQLAALTRIRQERFELMERLEQLPDDMVFYTQITMEAGEDPAFLAAMRRARIRGALVGVESVTPEGLKAVFKNFNEAGEGLVTRLRAFRDADVHVLGSFIFGLPTDTPETFAATADLAQRAGVSFAQFVMLQPLPGTVDFGKWEREAKEVPAIDGVPLTRYWLIPPEHRPRVYIAAPADDGRGTAIAHAGRLGSLLRAESGVAALGLLEEPARPSGVRADLQAVSTDVREHGHRHRQCPSPAICASRAVAGAIREAVVRVGSHADVARAAWRDARHGQAHSRCADPVS